MSKSLQNFYTLRDLLEKGFTGREVRFALLAVNYRLPLNFSTRDAQGNLTFPGLVSYRAALHRIAEVRRRRRGGGGGAHDSCLALSSFIKPADSGTIASWRSFSNDLRLIVACPRCHLIVTSSPTIPSSSARERQEMSPKRRSVPPRSPSTRTRRRSSQQALATGSAPEGRSILSIRARSSATC